MNGTIGRVRHPREQKTHICERRRAYRFPIPFPWPKRAWYDPDKNVTIAKEAIARLGRSNRAHAKRLNRALKKLANHDIAYVEIRGRSSYLRITLVENSRFIDYANRWSRIEHILSETFSLSIETINPPRFRW